MFVVILPPTTGIGRVDLSIESSATVLDFYRSVIGLRTVADEPRWIDLGVDGQPLIRLLERPELGPRPPEAAGLFHLAIRVPTNDALASVARRMVDADRLAGASDHGVSEALYGRDPVGNGVEVYVDRPRAQWPTTNGGVDMTTQPLDLDSLLTGDGGRDELPPESDMGHIHLEVTDLEKSASFYIDELGFTERDRRRGARFVAAGDYHHHIGFNTWGGRSEPASGVGLKGFIIEVPTRRALKAVARHTDETIDEGELVLQDPDGIVIRFRQR